MGMCGERNTYFTSCTILLRMLNVMPLEQHVGEELRKEVNSAHIASLNMTEKNQQDREDSSTQGPGARATERKGNKSASKESSRKKQTVCMHVGLKVTESEQVERRL